MKLSDKVISWTRDYLNSFGGSTKAVIGISGGKDSTIAAKICVEAVGADRVICVRMPNGNQHDLSTAREVCDYLNVKSYEINIFNVYNELARSINSVTAPSIDVMNSYVFTSNTPSRIRMTILYGIAAAIGDCRVVNTCNRSEDYIGYSTKFGDSAGDFSPLSNLLVEEVLSIGDELGIPSQFVHKPPEDGLSGKTDEDNIGFTYLQLDHYIKSNGNCPDLDKSIIEKIENMHKIGMHKILPMPKFEC